MHELIIAPESMFEDESPEETRANLLQMVKEVNQEVVESSDFLADHVYYVDYGALCITTVA